MCPLVSAAVERKRKEKSGFNDKVETTITVCREIQQILLIVIDGPAKMHQHMFEYHPSCSAKGMPPSWMALSVGGESKRVERNKL
jgi:hypothetical protein